MFQSIYSKPLSNIILAIVIAIVAWGYLRTKVQLRRWTMANFVLFCAAVIAILYATILNRTPGNYELILTLSLIHISEPTRLLVVSRMPSSA